VKSLLFILAASASVLLSVSQGFCQQWVSLDPSWRQTQSSKELAEKEFDRSLNLAPPYGIDQNDPGTWDLWGDYDSDLCFPASLANALIYESTYAPKPAPELALVGMDPAHSRVNVTTLLRYLTINCNTKAGWGTDIWDAGKCILDYYAATGFHKPKVVGYMATAPGDTYYEVPDKAYYEKGGKWVNQAPTPSVIRKALDAGMTLLLSTDWFWPPTDDKKPDRRWARGIGHYFNVYGYDYDKNWKNEKIILKVSNPDGDYSGVPNGSPVFDSVTLRRLDPSTGYGKNPPPLEYPSKRYYVIEGPGFSYPGQFAFLDSMFVMSPGTHDSPTSSRP